MKTKRHTYTNPLAGAMRHLRHMAAAAAWLPVMALLAIAAQACHDDDTPPGPGSPTVDPAEVLCRAGFYVTTSGEVQLSRAPSQGTYEPGTPIENYIDIEGKDFDVLLFNSADLFVGKLTDVLITPVSVEGIEAYKRYYVSGLIPAAVPSTLGGQLKVMMLANWGIDNYPNPADGTSLTDVVANAAGTVFEHPYGTPLSIDNLIPMFGVTNLLTGLEFEPGWSTDLGTLHLLRAYAQVRLRAAENSLGIVSAAITRANSHGYRAPLGVSAQNQYVHGNYPEDYWHTPSIPAVANVKTNLPLTEETDGTWRIYIPEFVNIDSKGSALDTRSQIEVQFEGDDIVHRIEFMYYDNPPEFAGPDVKKGDYFDILRNNIYSYTLNRPAGETEMKVEVDVIPYTEVVLKPNFGLDRDNLTGWLVVNKDGQKYFYDDRNNRYYDKNKNPIATRVERTGANNELYVMRHPLTRELRYVFNSTTGKYYLDIEQTQEIKSPDDCPFLPRAEMVFADNSSVEVTVLRTKEDGKALYIFYKGHTYNHIWSPVDTPNFAIQQWGKDTISGYDRSQYMVIYMDEKKNPVFFYRPSDGKYFMDDVSQEGFKLTEVEAF